jgi:exopolyphosphatase/guanosine-5'-triphosphate,3'-diphosphate pyrophosphatase
MKKNAKSNAKTIAAVDIGSNTMLMLIAEMDFSSFLSPFLPAEGVATPRIQSETAQEINLDIKREDIFSYIRSQTIVKEDLHSIARLGEGVDKTGFIAPEALSRALEIAHRYREICRAHGVETIAAVTTSAVRDARNATEITRSLSEALGADVRCITGDEEARLSFLGTSETGDLCTVVDIGGGSVEYVTGKNDFIYRKKSLQMGAVRLHERFFSKIDEYALPPSEESILAARVEIRRQLSLLESAPERFIGHTTQAQGYADSDEPTRDKLLLNKEQNLQNRNGSLDASSSAYNCGEIIGVGGTFTTLAAIDLGLKEYDSARVHLHSIDAARVREIVQYLCSSSLAELLKNPAIHPKRADILPAGALILEETLRYFDAPKCTASVKGLRYGVLYEALRREALRL